MTASVLRTACFALVVAIAASGVTASAAAERPSSEKPTSALKLPWPDLTPGMGYVTLALTYPGAQFNNHDVVRFSKPNCRLCPFETAQAVLHHRGTSLYLGAMRPGRYRIDSILDTATASANGGLFHFLATADVKDSDYFEVEAGVVTDLGLIVMENPRSGKVDPAGFVPAGVVERLRSQLFFLRPDLEELPFNVIDLVSPASEKRLKEIATSGERAGPVVAWRDGVALLGALGTVRVRDGTGAWRLAQTPVPLALRAIATGSDGTLWVGGEYGAVFRSTDGVEWSDESLPSGTLTVRILWSSPSGDVFALAGEDIGWPTMLQVMKATKPQDEWGWHARKMTLFRRAADSGAWTPLRSVPGWGFGAEHAAFDDALWIKLRDEQFLVVGADGALRDVELERENIGRAGLGVMVAWNQYESSHGKLQLSKDGGTTWSPVGDGDKRKGFVSKTSPAYLVDGALYAIAKTRIKAGSQVYVTSLYVSRDQGANWTVAADLDDACADPDWMGVVSGRLMLLCYDGRLVEPLAAPAN